MAFDYKYMKGPVILQGAADFNFNQNTEIQIPHNVEMAINRGAGSVIPGYVAIMSAKPVVTIATTELARVLGITSPLTGLLIASGQTYTSVDFYFMRRSKGGTLYSGSNHMKVSAAAAMMVMKTISADQDGEAKASIEFHPYSTNGTTAQLSYALTEAAVSEIIPSEKFTLGPVLLNGTEIDGLQSVSIDFGVTTNLSGASGAAYPEWAGIESVSPKITFKTTDLSVASDISLGGLAQGATQTDIYLRKLSLGGTRVANATAEHIRIRVNASQGMHIVDQIGGSEVADGEGSFTIQPIEGWSVGSLVPVLSISAAIAIP